MAAGNRKKQEQNPLPHVKSKVQASRLRKNLVRTALVAILAYIALRLFVFDIYFIRSSSMRNSLLEGDYVLVNKFIWNSPNRYDVIVFEPPVKDSSYGGIDSYIKRCVGIPGDTIRIDRGILTVNGVEPQIPGLLFHYHVITSRPGVLDSLCHGFDLEPGSRMAGSSAISIFLQPRIADSVRVLPGVLSVEMTLDDPGWFDRNVFPYAESMPWNLDNFGPLIVPKKGMTIPLNGVNFTLYKGTILLFERKQFEQKDGKYLLNGEVVDSYTFENDYYFGMGDNRHASSDSRAWGFIPSSHLQGTSSLILWSTDPETDNARPHRRFSFIH